MTFLHPRTRLFWVAQRISRLHPEPDMIFLPTEDKIGD